MSKFDETLEIIMEMDFEEREMLIEIVRKRQTEARRNEISLNALKARKALHSGKLKAQPAKALIEELNHPKK